MTHAPITVLVTGATGNQGSAVTSHLLASKQVQVRCLVRDPNSASAKKLQSEGAGLFTGDFDNIDSLQHAIKGCHAVFFTPMPGPDSIAVKHTRNIIGVAEEEGVIHFICSTVCRASEYEEFTFLKQNPGHFMHGYWQDKKDLVKQFRHDDDRSTWTIIQPAWLMSNFIAPGSHAYWNQCLRTDGVIETAFEKDTPVQLTSGDDVGACATAAILGIYNANAFSLGPYHKQAVPLASDTLTIEEIAAAMGDVSGRNIQVNYLSREEIDREVPQNPFISGQRWAAMDGTGVEMREVHQLGLNLYGFRSFLEKNRDALIEAVSAPRSE